MRQKKMAQRQRQVTQTLGPDEHGADGTGTSAGAKDTN